MTEDGNFVRFMSAGVTPFAGDHPKDHDGGWKLRAFHDGDLLDVLADPPVVLPVALLILVDFFHQRRI